MKEEFDVKGSYIYGEQEVALKGKLYVENKQSVKLRVFERLNNDTKMYQFEGDAILSPDSIAFDLLEIKRKDEPCIWYNFRRSAKLDIDPLDASKKVNLKEIQLQGIYLGERQDNFIIKELDPKDYEGKSIEQIVNETAENNLAAKGRPVRLELIKVREH